MQRQPEHIAKLKEAIHTLRTEAMMVTVEDREMASRLYAAAADLETLVNETR